MLNISVYRNSTKDHSWINALRTSVEYQNGVRDFIEFAKQNANDVSGKFYCPCVKCLNERRLSPKAIHTHLICEGFCKTYTVWVWHGEKIPSGSQHGEVAFDDNDTDMDDRMEDIICDVGEEAFHHSHAYGNMCSDAETPLYPGCKKYQLLNAVLKLVSLKARHGWSDKSFFEMLEAFKDMLPDDNVLPHRYYDAKKILCPWGWSTKRSMHARMIAYCIGKSLQRCRIVRYVKPQGTSQIRGLQKCCGIFQSYQGSSGCLRMKMMQKI